MFTLPCWNCAMSRMYTTCVTLFIWIGFFFSPQSFRFPRMDNTQCVRPLTHSPSFPLCSFCPSSHSCCWIKLNNSCGAEGTWLVCCCEFQQTIFYSSSWLSCSLRVSGVVSLRVWPAGVLCVCVFVCMYVEHHPHVIVTLRQFHYLLQHTKQVSPFSTVFIQ